jgi:hypothetical protein
MTSVPARNSGLASAINNALSRIGPLLATAVIFIGVSAIFYAGLEARLPHLQADSAAVHQRFSPLNPPKDASPQETEAARDASTDAFHLAMLIAALLCGTGAVVNGLGIRNPVPAPAATAREERAAAA